MTRPGDRLRSFAARWCSDQTMARVIDPLIADLQAEHTDALVRGRIWRSHWIRIAGCAAFVKVIALHGAGRAVGTLRNWPVGDRRALGRTVGISIVATAITIVFGMGQYILRYVEHGRQDLLLYLIPQAIPGAVPFGLTFGIFAGLGGRVSSRRLLGSAAAIALFSSVGSFATMNWVVPSANQAFRVAASGQPDIPRGFGETTFRELSQRIEAATQMGQTSTARTLTRLYHGRTALVSASVALPLLVLSLPCRPVRKWASYAAALGVSVAYYALLGAGMVAERQGLLSVFLAAWLPNLVFGVVSLALLMRMRRAEIAPT